MRAFVTGAAGFIGSTLVDELLARGETVVGFDNLSTGFLRFLDKARTSNRFTFVEGDVLDTAALQEAMAGADIVYHLQANADVRFGPDHPDRDLRQNTIATHGVLEAMRLAGVKRLGFSSTGSVYGEAKLIPTPEDGPFPIQTSLYGASKLACEGLITAYCESFGFVADIYRFVSIMGPRYTHGHVFDFVRRLSDNPSKLRILGDGKQRKSYLFVEDCVSAILRIGEQDHPKAEIYNLGHDSYCNVDQSAGWIASELGVQPEFEYTGGDRGWIGDNPFIHLSNEKLRGLGWSPTRSIEECVRETTRWLSDNNWVYDARH